MTFLIETFFRILYRGNLVGTEILTTDSADYVLKHLCF